KKEGGLSERSEFASLSARSHKFKGKSPSRARLSFAYFSLARQRKVSRSRQGTKGRWTTNPKTKDKKHPLHLTPHFFHG
ncbi:hypothetical protein, partial [Ralstonia thomasii]|uniref:hypothetical protein n=1 Tax=Ralstonia thomasii TaxID=3058596 RepID=UPI00292F4735